MTRHDAAGLAGETGFCRDCLAASAGVADRRCRSCGSPRMLRHPELAALSIAHLDCDAFYAAVEKRDDPSLADKPLIVGGGKRGVVTTACYIARIKGVRSAMPMFKALQLCPEAVVLRPNMAKYAEVGRAVRERMRALTPLVEPLSIDEAFMDLSGTERLHGASPARMLAALAQAIEREIGITVSVGLSHNKFLAKVASDLMKPRGFTVVGRAETLDFLAPRPVSAIWGVGPTLNAALERDGLRTIGQLQRMEEVELMRRHGSMGLRLSRLSRGIDARAVDPEGETKSISAETTFNSDLHRPEDLVPILRGLAEKVARRLKATDLAAMTIVLKLKSADFRIRTRNRKLSSPTRLANRIFDAGRGMLSRELDGTRYRLIGIGCSDFVAAGFADPADLVDVRSARSAKAEAAFDAVRYRFGNASIETGYTFGAKERATADAALKRQGEQHRSEGVRDKPAAEPER